MARAGGGGHGGGHSGGGHSSSRSSGGHRVGGSHSGGSRAGSGFGGGRSGGGFGGGHGGPGGPGGPGQHPPMHGGYHGPRWHNRHYNYHYEPYPRRRSGFGCSFGIIFTVIFILFIVRMAMFGMVGGFTSSSVPESTANREKVNTGVAFRNDCIIDELGWFDSTSRTAKKLQDFYDETGIQPFIYLRAYDATLTTDDEKLAFAEEWYEENIDNEGTFLYIYFAEADQDNDVGYMCYVNGKQVTSVMDSEAVDIFWAYLDNAWYSDMSTDDMFVSVFNSTANRIMDKSTTQLDVVKWIVIFAGAVVVLVLVMKGKKTKPVDEKVDSCEAERILDAMDVDNHDASDT